MDFGVQGLEGWGFEVARVEGLGSFLGVLCVRSLAGSMFQGLSFKGLISTEELF